MKKEIPERVWVTELALTEGVFEAKTELSNCEARKAQSPSGKFVWLWPNGHQWRSTRSEAIKKANKMRQMAVKKLETEIEILKAMNFEATAKSL